MKKPFIVSLLFYSLNSFGQMPTDATEIIDANNIRATINTNGTLFNNLPSSSTPGFEVPKDSGTHTIFTNAIWVGGLDASNSLHLAGMRYGSVGNDYWPGPISDTAHYTLADSVWNRLWKVSANEIETHKWNWWQTSYTAPEAISNWPAHGDTTKGQALNLAPFEDRNNNGVYEPELGDLPIIKGDEAVYFIFNDHRENHTETGGEKLGFEFHGMAYQFNCSNSQALFNTIFVDYTIFNRSSNSYYETYIGFFTDLDIGGPNDDFIASDVGRSLYFAFNGDNDDQDMNGSKGYGTKPPAQSCTFLKGPMQDSDGIDNAFGIADDESVNGIDYGDGIIDNERRGMDRFLYFNQQGAASTSDPETSTDFYNYLNGVWRDGTNMAFGGTGHVNSGGTIPAKFMFPETSDSLNFGTWGINPNYPYSQGWSEDAEGNTPADRRGIGSTGPFTFDTGGVEEITMAFTFAQSDTGGVLGSVALLKEYADDIRTMFLSDSTPCNYGTFSSVEGEIVDQVQNDIKVYPNPTKEQLFITHDFNNPTYEVYDIYGKLIARKTLRDNSIDISNLAQGIYILRVQDQTVRFIKE